VTASNNLAASDDLAPATVRAFERRTVDSHPGSSLAGLLIINADDWGRDIDTTNRILECVLCGSVSSTSGMVFMEDSERAASVARERGVDVGLHLNVTTPFSVAAAPSRLSEHQERIAHFLLRNRLSQAIYHPGLMSSFQYVVTSQIEEFGRLYGEEPRRVDGHHHRHLCANVLLGGLLPSGIIVRRNFSFQPGEKSGLNRMYREVVDRILSRRHRLADFFFSLPPLEPAERLDMIFSLARRSVVEVESHPINPEEYRFLAEGEIFRRTGDVPVATSYKLSNCES